jgi:hypothetical protein
VHLSSRPPPVWLRYNLRGQKPSTSMLFLMMVKHCRGSIDTSAMATSAVAVCLRLGYSRCLPSIEGTVRADRRVKTGSPGNGSLERSLLPVKHWI